MNYKFNNYRPQVSNKILSLTPYLLPKSPYTPTLTTNEEPLFFKQIKKRVFLYRLIFLFLGTLFISLAGMLFFHLPNWSFHVIFGHGLLFKSLLSFISSTLGIAALWMGCSLRTAIEAMYFAAKSSRMRIKKSYIKNAKSQLNEKKYAIAIHEIETNLGEAIAQFEEIDNKQNLKDKKKKALAIDLLTTLKRRLERIVEEFSS